MYALAATVEVVDFVEEGQAEAFLAMDIRERNKKHVYPEIEKVGNILPMLLEQLCRNILYLICLLQGGKT